MKATNLRLNSTKLYELKPFNLSSIQPNWKGKLQIKEIYQCSSQVLAQNYTWQLTVNNSFSSDRVVIPCPHHWSWIQVFWLLKPLSCVLCLIRLILFVCRCNSKPSWCHAWLLPKALLWWHIPQLEPNACRQREADFGDEELEWSKCLHCLQSVANSLVSLE